MQRKPWRTTGGFTIVELMVVISVIMILAGLMFPVAALFRGITSKAECQNRLRQIWTVVSQYARNNNGEVPQITERDGTRHPVWRIAWYQGLTPRFRAGLKLQSSGSGPGSYDTGSIYRPPEAGAMANPGGPHQNLVKQKLIPWNGPGNPYVLLGAHDWPNTIGLEPYIEQNEVANHSYSRFVGQRECIWICPERGSKWDINCEGGMSPDDYWNYSDLDYINYDLGDLSINRNVRLRGKRFEAWDSQYVLAHDAYPMGDPSLYGVPKGSLLRQLKDQAVAGTWRNFPDPPNTQNAKWGWALSDHGGVCNVITFGGAAAAYGIDDLRDQAWSNSPMWFSKAGLVNY